MCELRFGNHEHNPDGSGPSLSFEKSRPRFNLRYPGRADLFLADRDRPVPLNTCQWTNVVCLLNQTSEYLPWSLLNDLVDSIVAYADDQAHRGYVLALEELAGSLNRKAVLLAPNPLPCPEQCDITPA